MKEILIDNYIWDRKADKPFDVFLTSSETTRLALGWFNLDYTPTEHGEQQITLLKTNTYAL